MNFSAIKGLIPGKIRNALKNRLGVPSLEMSFERIKKLGFSPLTCLDIGAYEGLWTIDFKQQFPGASVLMIEGQTEKKAALQKIKDRYDDVEFTTKLLGASNKTVSFNIYQTASSVLTENNVTGARIEERQLHTLDQVVAGTRFSRPDLIKIDTQGYELEILKGATNTMGSAEFILLEVSFIDIYNNVPLITEVLNFMQDRGYLIYDICTLMKRPLDNALYQSDILFVKVQSKFRSDKRWSQSIK